jgi:hypothetical protein
MKKLLAGLAAVIAMVSGAAPAHGWTRPGHMVTAAIAYDEIARLHPAALDEIGRILDAHPDRGPFQVAMDRTTGDERRRRMFLECARWPDDARQTAYDHPSWHAALSPVKEGGGKNQKAEGAPYGQAFEAFALNFRTLSDASVAPGERAVALCWVLHLAGDIHQPLHTAQMVSRAFPDGDRGGGLYYVRDPLEGAPISLHWLWDDAVHRQGEVATVDAKTAAITRTFPRSSLKELQTATTPAHFPVWAQTESFPLAVSLAYREGFPAAISAESAGAAPPDYWRDVQAASERRIAIAGYRMADLVWEALKPPSK